MFTTVLKEYREVNKKTFSTVDEALIKNKMTILEYIVAIILESKLVDNKERARLEMHYDFNHEDIMKEIESYFNSLKWKKLNPVHPYFILILAPPQNNT